MWLEDYYQMLPVWFRELFWFWVLFNCIIASFVFYEQRMKGRAGIGWAAFLILTGIIGLIIYWMVSSDVFRLEAMNRKRKTMGERAISYSTHARDMPENLGALSKPPVLNEVPDADGDAEDKTLAMFIHHRDYRQAKIHIDKMIKLAQERNDWATRQKYIELKEDLDLEGREWMKEV